MIASDMIEALVESTQWLITPIYVVLWIGIVWLAFQCGQTMRDGLQRRWRGGTWQEFLQRLRIHQVDPWIWCDVAYSHLHLWMKQRVSHPSDLDLVLPEAEAWIHRKLGRYQLWIRTGPMFGLIGTLIPLGPSLRGLAQANLHELSSNLSVAFTTTILGIGVGAVAYWIFTIRRAWFEQDLVELEYVAAYIKNKTQDSIHGE